MDIIEFIRTVDYPTKAEAEICLSLIENMREDSQLSEELLDKAERLCREVLEVKMEDLLNSLPWEVVLDYPEIVDMLQNQDKMLETQTIENVFASVESSKVIDSLLKKYENHKSYSELLNIKKIIDNNIQGMRTILKNYEQGILDMYAHKKVFPDIRKISDTHIVIPCWDIIKPDLMLDYHEKLGMIMTELEEVKLAAESYCENHEMNEECYEKYLLQDILDDLDDVRYRECRNLVASFKMCHKMTYGNDQKYFANI